MTVDDLIEIYADVLETPGIGPGDDFFAAGGDSLLATRVLSAVHRATGVELTFEEFLADPTPAGLAGIVAPAGTAVPR